MKNIEVICTNVGTVYQGHNHKDAKKVFKEYVKQSESLIGRAGGESVTMLKDGEVSKEFTGYAGAAE